MTDDMFNLLAAAILGLNLIASVTAIIISAVALRKATAVAMMSNAIAEDSNKVADSSNQIAAQAFKIAEESNKIAEDSNGIAFESKNVAEQSAQLAVRTSSMANAAVSRDKWQKEMREVTSNYLTAVSRLCYEHEAKPDQAYVEFLHAHYLLSLYLTTASRELDRKLFLKLEEVRGEVDILMLDLQRDKGFSRKGERSSANLRREISEQVQKNIYLPLCRLIGKEPEKKAEKQPEKLPEPTKEEPEKA